MQETLRRMREKRVGGDHGFTLIELLVVVVIIGVLVAIAIPLYSNYRKGAENKSAETDIRGAITAVEQFYTDNGNAYPADADGAEGVALSLPALSGGTGQTASVSAGNKLSFRNKSTYYVLCAQNSHGQTIYVYNSSSGKPVAKSDQTTFALCLSAGT